ncbi:MAG: hypothetical protein Kow00123_13050 [Anaerolineales bacterium]
MSLRGGEAPRQSQQTVILSGEGRRISPTEMLRFAQPDNVEKPPTRMNEHEWHPCIRADSCDSWIYFASLSMTMGRNRRSARMSTKGTLMHSCRFVRFVDGTFRSQWQRAISPAVNYE